MARRRWQDCELQAGTHHEFRDADGKSGPEDISVEETPEKPAGASPKKRSFIKKRSGGRAAAGAGGTSGGTTGAHPLAHPGGTGDGSDSSSTRFDRLGHDVDDVDGSDDEDIVAMPDKLLLARLKAWRLDIARNHGIPAFRIPTDKSIRQIAIDKPTTVEALGSIAGIGRRFLDEHADDILKLIARD